MTTPRPGQPPAAADPGAALRTLLDALDTRLEGSLARERDADGGPARRPAPGDGCVVGALGEHTVGLDASAVDAVQRPSSITPVPHAPRWVIGLSQLRGEVVPLVDTAALIGLPVADATREHRPALIVRTASDGQRVGLVVDRVHGLRSVRQHADDEDPSAEHTPPTELAPFVDRSGQTESGPVDVLSLSALLAAMATAPA